MLRHQIIDNCTEGALDGIQVVGYGNVAFIAGGLDLNAEDASDTLYK